MLGRALMPREVNLGKRERLPRGWARLRQLTFERDGGICQIGCLGLPIDAEGRPIGRPRPGCTVAADEIDHIVERQKGGSHDLANLRAVCSFCHAQRKRRPSQTRLWV